MSDTDEDFASADEGEFGASAKVSKGTKEQKDKKKSSPPVKANVQDPKLDDKTTDTDKVAAKDSSITVNTQPKRGQKKANVAEKGRRSGKEKEKKFAEVKSEAKKGMQKGGKSKDVDKASSSSKMEKTKTDIEKSQDDGEETVGKEANADNDECCNSKVKPESETNIYISKPTECEKTSDNNQQTGDKADNTETQTSPELKLDSSESTFKNVLTSEDSADLTPGKEISSEPQKKVTVAENVAMIKSPSSQNIARPKPDHTDRQEAVLDQLAGDTETKTSGWGWGWGKSLLDVASTSVSTFTNQVGEGLHTMIETVESTLNVPNPEELAQTFVKKKEMDDKQSDGGSKETGIGSKVEVDIANTQSKTSQEPEDQSIKPEKADDQSANTELAEQQSVKTENTEPQSSEAGEKADNQSGEGWFSAWGVSNITKMVESTGKNLVTGSLDVLETLGKKTFDVINDHDPGLKKARGFLHDRGDKPNLSAVLREAKEQQEARTQQEKESEEARKAHFGSLFDDFQGLAHLEALEMLSNQSEKRVNVLLNALPAEAISTLKPQLLEIKQNFVIEDTDDDDEVTEQEFGLLVTSLLKELDVGTTPVKLLKTHDQIDEHITECCEKVNDLDVKEIHRLAISSLAELTSKCIEQFHKAGELMLIQRSMVPDLVHCSDTLLRLTKVLTAEVGILSTKFSACLNKHDGDEIKVNHLVTNIYLEASNSGSYVQDGFQLLLPVFQQVAIEKSQEPES